MSIVSALTLVYGANNVTAAVILNWWSNLEMYK